MRALDGSVVPVNTDHKYNYKWGLDRFVQEARTLAKFSHPNIVRVNRFFDANGTSYMVMDYEAGESLSQYLRRNPVSDEAGLKKILLPILDGLQAVHQAGFLHRDIKPSNVFIRENGLPVLLDFGAARMAVDGNSKSLTAIVSPGYAPLEQYTSDGNQGPWSDIYALAGVMFRAVTGETPPEPVRRMKDDNTVQALAGARAKFSGGFVKAIEWGMAMDEKKRPQKIAEWREALSESATSAGAGLSPSSGSMPAKRPLDAVSPVAQADLSMRRPSPSASSRRLATTPIRRNTGVGSWLLAAIGIAILGLVFMSAGAIWTRRHQAQTPAPTSPATVTAEPDPKSEPPAGAPTPPAVQSTPTVQSSQGAQPSPSEQPSSSLQPSPSVQPSPSLQSSQSVPLPQDAKTPLPKPSLQGDIPAAVKLDFDRADNDANGYLTPDEVKGRFPFIERSFPRVDTNGDGRISVEEFFQLRKMQMNLRPRQ
jgi:serine/threonine protein kinase